jgi:hypothetical protein
MAFVKVRVPRTSQPQELVGIDQASGWTHAVLAGIKSDTGGAVVPYSPTVLPIGKANTVTLASAATFSLSIPKTSSWSILFSGELVSKNSSYPYFLGCTGAANAFAVALNHANFSDRATFYDGVAVKDSGVTMGLGEYATIGLTFNAPSGTTRWYKNGVAFLTQTGIADVGGTAWQYAAASGEGNTTIQALLAFAQKALSPQEMLLATSNPWQLFEPEERLIWIPDAVSAGGGATVIPIGQQAIGSVGSPTATGAATTAATGISAASAVGTPTAIGGAAIPATVSPAGVISASSVGTPTATGASVTSANGVQAISVVGTPTAVAGSSIPATVTPAGVIAHASVGTPSANGASIAYAGGISAFAAVGSPTAIGGVSGQATALPSGVQAIGYVGVPTATAAVVVYASGVQAIGYVGMPIALGDPVAFTPSVYQAISPAQSYTVTSPAQSYTVTVQPQTYIA